MSGPSGSLDLNSPPDSPDSNGNTNERWDRVRRHFLPAHRIWPYPHPAQNVPSNASNAGSISGRSSPRHWDNGLGRLGARVFRHKQPLNLSEAQRFRDDLMSVLDPQRTVHGKFHTYGAPSLMARHRQNTPQNDLNSSNLDNHNITPNSIFQTLSKLARVIDKFNNSRNLPDFTSSFILELLARPFNGPSRSLDLSLCSLALDIFEKICTEFQSNSEDDTLQRWIWCCHVMYINSAEIRDRTSRLLLTLTLPPSDANEETSFPTSSDALESFFSSLVIIYYSLQADTQDQSQVANRNIIFSLLKRCTSGQIIGLDSTEASLYCLRSLLKLALASEVHLGCFILTEMLQSFWEKPKTYADQSFHVLCLYAQTCTAILSKIAVGSSSDLIRQSIWSFVKTKMNMESSLKSSESIMKSMFHVIFSIYTNIPVETCLKKVSGLSDLHFELSPIHGILADVSKYLELAVIQSIPREHLITTVLDIIADGDLNNKIIPCMTAISCGIPDEHSKDLMSKILPAFFKCLVGNPVSTISDEVKDLMMVLQARFPQPFYKPLLTCAASDKEQVILNQLNVIYAICSIIGDVQYFCKDAEMLTVALLGSTRGKNSTDAWGSVKMGQLILFVEVNNALSQARLNMEEDEISLRTARGFAEALEPRLSVFLKAKEQNILIPIAQRQLVANLFFEIRLITKSSRHAGYTSRMVKWTSCLPGTTCTFDEKENNPFLDNKSERNTVPVTDIIVRSTIESLTSAQNIYRSMEQEVKENNTKIEGSPTISTKPNAFILAHVRNCNQVIKSSLILGLPMLSVLVTLCEKLSDEDLVPLFSILWYYFLEFKKSEILRPASFLILFCAEKQGRCVEPINDDLQSDNPIKRQKTISKLSLLFGVRTSIMAQRFGGKFQSRLFVPPAISMHTIVPTDIGSTEYTWSSAATDVETQKAGAHLPLEVRKALVQLGWEDGSVLRSTTEREMFPLSSVPSHSINSDQVQGKSNPKNTATPHKSAMDPKRPHKGARHRTVLGPHIVGKMIQATFLIHDQDAFISNAASQLAYAITRDDISYTTRTMLADLSGKYTHQQSAIHAFYHLSLLRPPIPSSFAHFTFNHMLGLAKERPKVYDAKIDFQRCSLLIPSIARLSTQVSEFTLRDVTKNKMEYLLLPTGAFNFETNTPTQPSMLPDNMLDAPELKILNLPRHLLQLCTIRAAQNLLLTNHLTKNPHDAYIVRGTISKLFLPIASVDIKNNQLPQIKGDILVTNEKVDRYEQEIYSASLQVARTWLLLCTRIVFGLSRFFHDALELNRVLEGVATILNIHGNDLSIVSHTVHLCMLCSNRFKRIFSSSAEGFNFFIPILFRCFVEANGNEGIRECITYCFSRLYFVHEETFVFHLFASLRPIFFRPSCNDEIRQEMISSLALLLSGLSQPQKMSSDLAGVFGIISQEEKDMAVMDITERPQHFFGKSKDGTGIEHLRPLWMFDRPKLFPIEDSLKLLFTAIAYNPNSSGSQHFLSYAAHLVPFFWESGESCRIILHDCIEALVDIYSKGAGVKNRDDFVSFSGTRASQLLENGMEGTLKPVTGQTQASWNSSREILILITVKYTNFEGKLRPSTWRKILEILKSLLKEGTTTVVLSKRFYISLIEVMIGHHASNSVKHIKAMVNELAQLFETHITSPIFTSLLDAWLDSSVFGHSVGGGSGSKKTFEETVVKRFVKPAIEACAKAALEDTSLPIRESTVRLVAKLIEKRDEITIETVVKQEPTAGYFATFFIPICLNMEVNDSSKSLRGESSIQHSFAAASGMDQGSSGFIGKENSVWSRLIGYIIKVGDNNWSGNDGGVYDVDNGTRSPRNGWTVSFALHALKVIIIRGFEDIHLLSDTELWNYLSYWMKRVLRESDSAFVAQTTSTSPRHSFTEVIPQLPNGSWDNTSNLPAPQVRVIDHALWSMMEFIMIQRNVPLAVLLKDFVQDKLSVANTLSSFSEKTDSTQQRMTKYNNDSTQYLSAPGNVPPDYNQGDSRATRLSRNPTNRHRTSFQRFAEHYTDFVQISKTMDRNDISSGSTESILLSTKQGGGSSSDRSATVSPSPSPTSASPRRLKGFPRIRHLGLSTEAFAARRNMKETSQRGHMSTDFSKVDNPTFVHSDILRVRTVQRVRNVMIMMGMRPVWHHCLGYQNTSAEQDETTRHELTCRWSPAESLRRTALEISALMREYDMLEL